MLKQLRKPRWVSKAGNASKILLSSSLLIGALSTSQISAYQFESDGGKVTGSYGTATAKPHADILYTEQNKTDNDIPTGKDVGDVKQEGLKTILIREVKAQAQGILNQTDWYVVRKADTDEAIPSNVATHRAAVRTKQASMETSITNASDTPALQTLFTYTTNSDTGAVTRPIGEIPKL